MAENDSVVALLETTFDGIPFAARPIEFWLGAYQPDPMSRTNEGWTWITGEPWEFTRWNAGEPNDFGGRVEDWLAIWGWNGNGSTGWWNDEGNAIRDTQGRYIIEYPVGALDCNENSVPDAEEIRNDATLDANGNGVLDACEPDCNGNGVADETDLLAGTSRDCSGDLVPDECEVDCNANDIPDECDLAAGTSPDCDENGVPDECDFAVEQADCNNNGQLDACELLAPLRAEAMDDCADAQSICTGVRYVGFGLGATNDGTSTCKPTTNDRWYRYRPASDGQLTLSTCESDHDTAISVHTGCPGTVENELACNDDACGLQSLLTVPVQAGMSYLIRIASRFRSRTSRFVLELEGPTCTGDCNANGVLDECEFADGTSQDCNGNAIPDQCENAVPGDTDGDRDVDLADYLVFLACFGGPVAVVRLDCCLLDRDGDLDIDLADLLVFQNAFTGALEPEPEPSRTGTTSVPGTWEWDIESDTLGTGTDSDVWWNQLTPSERQLYPQNGAQLVLVTGASYEEVSLSVLQSLSYSDAPISGSDGSGVLGVGVVLAMRTSDGNYAKLRIDRYREIRNEIVFEWALYER